MFDSRMVGMVLFGWFFTALVLAGELVGVTPDELEALQKEGATLVDIRTPEEWRQSGLVSGSQPLMYFDEKGNAHPEEWERALDRLTGGRHDKVVLICRSGRRSEVVGKWLSGERGYQKVYHLEKGIGGWSAKGNPLSPCSRC